MGAFFDSIHVRTENSDLVQNALEQLAKEKDLDGALDDYNKALNLKPDFAAARTNHDKAKQIKNSKNG
jgi:hypothetical protein